jgi:stage V sporulation protein K
MVGDADRLVVVAAGYAKEMKVFLESNTGFKSRFTDQWDFDHYNADELYRIFTDVICPENDYILTRGAKTKLKRLCKELTENADEYFGNGRTMQTVFTDTIEEQAARLVRDGLLGDKEALRTLDTADLVIRSNVNSPKAMA